MKTLVKLGSFLIIILISSCQDRDSNDDIDLIKILESDYNLVPVDTSLINDCLSQNVVFSYKSAHGKIVKNSANEYSIEVENPNVLQEQGFLYPCNLPEACQIDNLEVYIDGNVESNLAKNITNKDGIVVSIDGQQRIFLKNLWVRK